MQWIFLTYRYCRELAACVPTSWRLIYVSSFEGQMQPRCWRVGSYMASFYQKTERSLLILYTGDAVYLLLVRSSVKLLTSAHRSVHLQRRLDVVEVVHQLLLKTLLLLLLRHVTAGTGAGVWAAPRSWSGAGASRRRPADGDGLVPSAAVGNVGEHEPFFVVVLAQDLVVPQVEPVPDAEPISKKPSWNHDKFFTITLTGLGATYRPTYYGRICI